MNFYVWKNIEYKSEHRLNLDDIALAFEEVKRTYISDKVKEYCIDIFEYIHNDGKVYLPPSPRALLHVLRTASSIAYLKEREYVIPDDIKMVVPYVLAHRIILKTSSDFRDNYKYVKEVLDQVKVPKEVA
ncbi:MAG: hypothetical protein ABDH21_00155 [bacterium]